MSAAPSSFKRTDVKRACQALESAGLKVGRVEFEGGKFTIIPSEAAEIADDSNNSFDKILRK